MRIRQVLQMINHSILTHKEYFHNYSYVTIHLTFVSLLLKYTNMKTCMEVSIAAHEYEHGGP